MSSLLGTVSSGFALTTAGASLYTALDQYTIPRLGYCLAENPTNWLHIKRCVAPAPPVV